MRCCMTYIQVMPVNVVLSSTLILLCTFPYFKASSFPQSNINFRTSCIVLGLFRTETSEFIMLCINFQPIEYWMESSIFATFSSFYRIAFWAAYFTKPKPKSSCVCVCACISVFVLSGFNQKRKAFWLNALILRRGIWNRQEIELCSRMEKKETYHSIEWCHVLTASSPLKQTNKRTSKPLWHGYRWTQKVFYVFFSACHFTIHVPNEWIRIQCINNAPQDTCTLYIPRIDLKNFIKKFHRPF